MMSPPLSGDCLDIPQVTNDVTSRDGLVHWTVETHVVEGLDIDGYGSAVVLVPPSEADLHPDNMYWTLYLRRDECGYELGIIQGLDDPVLEPGLSHGLRNISTLYPAWSGKSEPRGNLIRTQYSFDGTRYRSKRPQRR